MHATLQFVVPLKLGQFYRQDQTSQFLVHLVRTIKGRLQKSCYLLAYENLKSPFRHKERCPHSLSILDRGLDVLLSEVLKRVDLVYNVLEDFVENVIDTCSSLTLCGQVPNESAFKKVAILRDKPVNHV